MRHDRTNRQKTSRKSALRFNARQQLMFLGHRVVACDNAQEALLQWRSGAFDVLMTDCNMPQMSGYALTEAIRRIEAQEGVGAVR